MVPGNLQFLNVLNYIAIFASAINLNAFREKVEAMFAEKDRDQNGKLSWNEIMGDFFYDFYYRNAHKFK